MVAVAVMLFLGCTNPVAEDTSATANINPLELQKVKSWDGGSNDAGQYWQLWKDDNGGTVNFTKDEDTWRSYSVNWNAGGNFTCGVGINPGYSDTRIDYTATFNTNGNSYLAFYGWSFEYNTGATGDEPERNNMVEFYVLESYGSWDPRNDTKFPMQYKGSFTTQDGVKYDIYRQRAINQPCLDGNQDFDKFWSIRNPKRNPGSFSGSIDFEEHVKAWEKNGMYFTSHWDYQMMGTEGFGSSGNCNVSVTIDTPTPVIVGPGMPGSNTTPSTTPSGRPEKLVALKAKYNSKYFTANSSNGKLNATASSSSSTWSQFYLVDLGHNEVALRCRANGGYVCAEKGGHRASGSQQDQTSGMGDIHPGTLSGLLKCLYIPKSCHWQVWVYHPLRLVSAF